MAKLVVDAAAPNCPHKLAKAAEPWLGGGAPLRGPALRAARQSAAVRSRRGALVAAAAAPSVGSRHGRRSLQLRVSTLGGRTYLQSSTTVHMPPTQVVSRRTIALCGTAAGGAAFSQME